MAQQITLLKETIKLLTQRVETLTTEVHTSMVKIDRALRQYQLSPFHMPKSLA